MTNKKDLQKVTIVKAFRDKDNFAKVYEVDSEVEFPKERAAYLKSRGLVDFDEPKGKGDDNPPVETIDLTQQHMRVISDVKMCINLEELTKALEAETKGANPRVSVVSVLQARIAELKPAE